MMGWKIKITTDKRLLKSDVRQALDDLGRAALKRKYRMPVELAWGWHGYLCDVYYPSENILWIGGAWGNFNGHGFARALSKKLRKLGYVTRIGRETE